ncbi:MAG: hypothetical protein LC118_06410 [Dehalococcoidia bacterium]|jgi:hypothetical protein|nr:hypothetical protein [Dehalococcoidia bacterium]MEB2284149.1 hypothetical protein [Myxococcales bacterium]
MGISATTLADARSIFGAFLLDPNDVARVLSISVPTTADTATVPYDRTRLEAARARGDILVYRVDTDGILPLTILRLLERFPETVQPQLLKGVGYQLKEEWVVSSEAFARTETCRPGWRLVHGSPVPSTCNRTYDQQDAELVRYAESLGLAGRLTRRRATEIVYDTILLRRAHGTRLLEHTWDWSRTPTQDGGFATVGEFGDDGLKMVGYSRAVRFGSLGVCPQL